MKKIQSKKLVVDASVARAAGGSEATHPTSAITRNFLQAVLEICHRIVMTPAIRDEWDQHESNFARKWRRSMVARGKLIALNIAERADIRIQIEAEEVSKAEKNAMTKDCLLIEAALFTDKKIISLDDTARKLFVGLSNQVVDIRDVQWVNPVWGDGELVTAWLKGESNGDQWHLAFKA